MARFSFNRFLVLTLIVGLPFALVAPAGACHCIKGFLWGAYKNCQFLVEQTGTKNSYCCDVDDGVLAQRFGSKLQPGDPNCTPCDTGLKCKIPKGLQGG